MTRAGSLISTIWANESRVMGQVKRSVDNVLIEIIPSYSFMNVLLISHHHIERNTSVYIHDYSIAKIQVTEHTWQYVVKHLTEH